MPIMTLMSLAAAVVTRTGKIMKNGLHVFERGENLLQNGIFNFVFTLSQSPEIALKGRIYADEKLTFRKRAWHLKG